MLLDSVLDENAIVNEAIISEDSLTDALVECMVGIEQAHGEMMLEQAKEEFRQYVNEGKIEPLSEGVVEKIKNVFAKIWAFIKKYFYKLKNFITGLHKNAYQYYSVNKKKIDENADKVTRFYGYDNLKGFDSTETEFKTINKAVNTYKGLIQGKDTTDKDYNSDKNKAVKTFKSEVAPTYEENGFGTAVKIAIRGAEKESEIKYSAHDLQYVLGDLKVETEIAKQLKDTERIIKEFENVAYTYAHTDQKDLSDDDKKSINQTKVNSIMEVAKLASNACSIAGSMSKEIIAQALRYAKMAVAGKSDDERKDESANMTDADAKAYLESIGLA